MQLASKFDGRLSSLRSDVALTDAQIQRVAPSIFAMEKHASRSERYTYIPTIEILQGLRKEGFSPFMVCQSCACTQSKREHTKHMVRLRHAAQIDGDEANEIILLNSHDGSSAYQMMAGVFRFVCANGMVCGDVLNDIRFRHSGNVIDNVIEGACRVLDDFDLVEGQKEGMKALTLSGGEQAAFARAALALRYDPVAGAAPVTEQQVLRPQRTEDVGDDLWRTLNRVQEHMLTGGLRGRSATGRTSTTRQITAIDQNIKLNRGLWVLAEEMQRLKG
ncbi:MAG: DUF932 domain-containing protein [Pseudomonadota bacterium]